MLKTIFQKIPRKLQAQSFRSVKVSLVEKTTTTFNNGTREQRREFQSIVISQGFDLKEDEPRKLPFAMPVDLGGKLSVDLFGRKLEIYVSFGPKPVYEVVATADLEGVALDPTAGKFISFT